MLRSTLTFFLGDCLVGETICVVLGVPFLGDIKTDFFKDFLGDKPLPEDLRGENMPPFGAFLGGVNLLLTAFRGDLLGQNAADFPGTWSFPLKLSLLFFLGNLNTVVGPDVSVSPLTCFSRSL